MDASFKPYLIRAMYEWCADNGFAPYLAVAVDGTCKVPLSHVRGGQLVLDISMTATHQLTLGNESIDFQARFGGVAQHLHVPISRVLGLFPEHDQSLGAFFDVSTVSVADSNTTEHQLADPQIHATDNDKNHTQTLETDAPVGKPRITRVK